MKLKTKQLVIRIISIVLSLISLGTAYLFVSGIVPYEPMQIEGAPTISLNVQIILLCSLAIINVLTLILCNKLIKYKKLLITFNIIQLLFGGVAHIVGSIVILVLLFIETTDVQEEKKPLELPKLERTPVKHGWIYFLIFALIFIVFYSGLVPMPFLQNLNPILTMAIIYIVQFIIVIPILWKDIKRDFLEFKGNFKTYMKYIFPKLGIFLISYIIITIPITLIVGGQSTNQSVISQIPLPATIIMAVFIAPVIEEFIFRGIVRKAFKNDIIFIIFSSLVFGAAHVLYAEENLLMYLYIIPYSFIGYFLARTYSKTNNIFSNITVHFVWNAVCMLITTLATLLAA